MFPYELHFTNQTGVEFRLTFSTRESFDYGVWRVTTAGFTITYRKEA